MGKELAVILNDIRSCENVGSILRTAEFFGFKKVFFVGVTPYPDLGKPSLNPSPSTSSGQALQGREVKSEGEVVDSRLPHVREKLDAKIRKVSLGAEENLKMEYFADLKSLIAKLKTQNWEVVALEQAPNSTLLSEFRAESDKLALVLGTERTGLSSDDLSLVDEIIEILRVGEKESLNVSVAFGIAAAAVS